MSKTLFAVSAPLALTCLSLFGCSSSSDSPATSNAGSTGESGGSSNVAGGSSAGAKSSGGDSNGGDSNGGDSSSAGDASENAGADTAGGAPSMGGAGGAPNPISTSPCSYAVTGGQAFPVGDVSYLCTASSRIYQAKGTGNTDALIGGAFYNESGDSSTFACSLDSTTPPKAGDTWVMSADHPGDCTLGYTHDKVGTLWAASSTLPTGAASITFKSVTKKNGTTKPEDVYYLYDATITVMFKGQTEGAPDVTFTGHFTQTSLPLGA